MELKFNQTHVDNFCKNICEDIEQDFRDYTKKCHKNRLVEYVAKNSVIIESELFKVREFNLGPR